MGQEPGTSRTTVTDAQDTEQLRGQIEETRQELGDTVEALAAKTNVKAHAARKLQRAKSAAGKPLPLATVGVLVSAVAAWQIWQLNKRRKAPKRRKWRLGS
jgi:hypothetical protein